jgi:hypothetical protein
LSRRRPEIWALCGIGVYEPAPLMAGVLVHRPRRVHPLLLVALIAAVLVLVVNYLRPHSEVLPAASPVPAPHFAIDDLDLGPTVRLTRFIPDFDVYPGRAVEGADGKLYIAYYPNRRPPQWHQIGGEPSRLGTLNDGRITPIAVSHDKTFNETIPMYGILDFAGLFNGLPVFLVRDGPAGSRRYFVAGRGGLRSLPASAYQSQVQSPPPCAPFDGGTICNEHEPGRYSAVRITTRSGRSILVGGVRYSYDVISYVRSRRQTRSVTEIGDVWLAGGGRHRFLIVEDHAGDGTAECLEGYAP